MEYDRNIILFDWLSFTIKRDNPRVITKLLGLDHCPWDSIKGMRGYQDRLYFSCISVHFNGRSDMGVWCEMSGQGCRTFETLTTLENGWDDLFQALKNCNANITRLDVAGDDHIGLLDIDEMIQDTRCQEYVSKADYWEITESAKGKTLQFGSPQSDTLIRIYDKAAERRCAAGTHWIRCEMQLRRERAKAFLDLDLSLGEKYCGVMVNYLRFVEPIMDSNRWRWPIKPYWGDFLLWSNAVRIYTAPGMEYNFDRCENYVIRQAGNAIDAYIQVVGVNSFLENLKRRRTMRNPKYDRLVEQYKALSL